MFKLFRSQWHTTLLALCTVGWLVGCGQTPPSPTSKATEETVDSVEGQATSTTGLTGKYFNNMDFTGTSVTRVDTTINKNFGTAAPVTGISANTYSVRWTGQVQPQYSETYTFYTTADDGVRLMVNGKILVDNWVNQGPTTKSSTIALQAGVKYDIWLEYYQNTSGAQIKLEWQSPSRTRQMVPQARLFATGSNLQAALARVKNLGAFKQTAVTISEPDSIARMSNGRTSLFARTTSSSLIIAGVSDDTVNFLYHYTQQSNQGVLKDLLTGKATNLGNMSFFINKTHSTSQVNTLVLKVALLLGEGAVKATLSTTNPNLIAQGPIANYSASNMLQPPVTCTDEFCREEARDYRDAVCAFSENVALLLAGGASILLAPLTGGWSFYIAAVGIGIDFWSLLELHSNFNAMKEDWANYLTCINRKDKQCRPYMDSFPQPINITRVVGSGDSTSTVLGSRSDSVSVLYIQAKFTSTSSGRINAVRLYSGVSLGPRDTLELGVNYNCDQAGFMTGKFEVDHNAANVSANPITVPVTINCIGSEEIVKVKTGWATAENECSSPYANCRNTSFFFDGSPYQVNVSSWSSNCYAWSDAYPPLFHFLENADPRYKEAMGEILPGVTITAFECGPDGLSGTYYGLFRAGRLAALGLPLN